MNLQKNIATNLLPTDSIIDQRKYKSRFSVKIDKNFSNSLLFEYYTEQVISLTLLRLRMLVQDSPVGLTFLTEGKNWIDKLFYKNEETRCK